MVEEIDFTFDFDVLKKEVESLIAQHKSPQQICLQGKYQDHINWQEGVGSTSKSDELLYTYLPSILQDYELGRLIKHFNGIRARIMSMSPRSSYSVHSDYSKRIHIPITTDHHAWMVWPYENYCKHLEVGKIYLTDTTKPHSFINGSLTTRVHLVMCVY